MYVKIPTKISRNYKHCRIQNDNAISLIIRPLYEVLIINSIVNDLHLSLAKTFKI